MRIGRRGPRYAGTWLSVPLTLVLLAGLAIRLPFLFVDTHISADPGLLSEWADALVRGGLGELLTLDSCRIGCYPPMSIVTLWALGSVAAGIEGGVALSVKALAITADIAIAAVIARMLVGRTPRVRVVAAGAIAFNPAIWYASAVWGQIDSVYVLLMTVAAWSSAASLSGRAGLAWAAAVATKLQALSLAPVLAVRALRLRGLPGLVSSTVAAALFVSVVTLALAASGDAWAYLGRIWNPDMRAVLSGFGGWYLARPLIDGSGTLADAIYGQASTLGLLGVGLLTVLVMVAIWRRPGTVGVALPALILVLGAFVTLVAMRERYLIAVLPFAILLAAGWESGRVSRAAALGAIALSASAFLNIVAVGSPLPQLWTNVLADGGAGPLAGIVAALGYAAAATNVIVLGVATYAVLRK